MLNAHEREKMTKIQNVLKKVLQELNGSAEVGLDTTTDYAWLVGYVTACAEEARELLEEINEMNG